MAASLSSSQCSSSAPPVGSSSSSSGTSTAKPGASPSAVVARSALSSLTPREQGRLLGTRILQWYDETHFMPLDRTLSAMDPSTSPSPKLLRCILWSFYCAKFSEDVISHGKKSVPAVDFQEFFKKNFSLAFSPETAIRNMIRLTPNQRLCYYKIHEHLSELTGKKYPWHQDFFQFLPSEVRAFAKLAYTPPLTASEKVVLEYIACRPDEWEICIIPEAMIARLTGDRYFKYAGESFDLPEPSSTSPQDIYQAFIKKYT